MKRGKVPKERLEVLWLFVYIASGLLALRLLDIQIIRHQYYKKTAERNRTQIVRQTAPRGRIFSSDGSVVAANRPVFSLIYLPGQIKNPGYLQKLARDFSPRLGIPVSGLMKILQKSLDSGLMVRVAENLPSRTMFVLSELKNLYPGIDLVVEAQRFYPLGNFASHLIGYIGQMDPKEWNRASKEERDYRMDSRVGKAGIEKVFERELKGRDGGLYLEVDAMGRLKQILLERTWHPGSDIYLTLDAQVQKAAEEGLRSSLSGKGAVVAVNPQNGAIIALASVPDFDPNLFIRQGRKSTSTLSSVPEFNMTIQGTFPPGSTFKIITAAAALETGKVSPHERFFCPGYYDAGSRVFRCWKKHRRMDFLSGFAHSCDVYFYNVGLKTGGANIEKFERAFRLGMPTGISLPGEKHGNIFGPMVRARKRSYWFIGDTLNLAIGQGELLVTPIQMAQVAAAVANRGTFWRPYYVDRIVSPEGRVLFHKKPQILGTVSLESGTWELLAEGMKSVVTLGTGRIAAIKGLDVRGKTGTAQNPLGKDHAWFVAYAGVPGRKPEIAVAVLVQHGEHGASTAAPIARRVIEAALRVRGEG